MVRKKKRKAIPSAHVAPAPVEAPTLLDEVPLIIRLERNVEDEYRDQMRASLKQEIAAIDASMDGTAPKCPKCQTLRPMKSRGRKNKSLVTRFGEIRLRVQTYACSEEGCKHTHRPLMDMLGVEAHQISGSLARLLALLGVLVPYELAAKLAHLFFGVNVSTMSVWRCVQRLGAGLEEYTDQLVRHHGDPRTDLNEPGDAPDAVILGVDGCALGMQVRERRRKRSGPNQQLPPLDKVKQGHFQEVKSGVLLLPSERINTNGRRTVVRRAIVSCLGNADEIFDRLWSKLKELGWYSRHTVVVIVGDGAGWIWNRASMFPNRCEILDFWHAVEKAWEFARIRFDKRPDDAQTWMSRLSKDLRAGKVEDVLARLRKMTTKSSDEQEKLDALIRYYENNATRMQYDEYIRRGYGIGSGAVESAHKQITHARMRQAGMRWSVAGAQRLLALRVLLLNGDWSMLDRIAMKKIAA